MVMRFAVTGMIRWTLRGPRVAVLVALLLAACGEGGRDAAAPNVHLRVVLGAGFDCAARDCLAAYRTFATANAAYARPRPDTEVLAEVAALDALPPPSVLDLDRRALRDAIIDGLNIGFVLDDLDARPLTVTVIDESPGPVTRRRLVFDDPLVGEFDALELAPAAPGPARPAIVGLHGHQDTPAIFAESYLGNELAAAGFVVVMPQLRAMNCFGAEAEFARTLLVNGFSLMGMRVYETLLVAKYLRARPGIDGHRLGLLTHSGGSSTGNLAVLVSDQFRAHVTDYFVDWRNRCLPIFPVHCETVPALFPLGPTIAAATDPGRRRLVVDYGFRDNATRAAVLDFFARALRPAAP